jgi:hypothetical protein
MLRVYKSILLVVGILVIGYLPRLIEQGYRLIYKSEITSFKLAPPSIACPQGEKFCVKSYFIPMSGNSLGDMSLLVGNIFTPSVWKCGGVQFFSNGDLSNIVSSRTTHNEYTVIDSSSLRKCIGKDIEAHVYYPKRQKKSGLRSGYIMLAPPVVASKIRSAHEFVLKDYKIINLCAMVCVLMFSFLIRIVSFDPSAKTRVWFSFLLAGGAVAQSCLLEVLIPNDGFVYFNRWLAMLTSCGYTAFAVAYFVNGEFKKWCLVLLGSCFFASLMLTQDRIATWIHFSLVVALVMLACAVVERSLKILFAGIVLFSAYLEVNGATWVPVSNVVPSFFAIVIAAENHRALLSFLKITRLLALSTKQNRRLESLRRNTGNLSIVKVFQVQFNIGQISILNVTDPEVIKILQFLGRKHSPNVITLDELPPVFASAITHGKDLVNISSNSKEMESIRRSSSKTNIASEYFSVFPLYSGQQIIGAIALTDYSADYFKSSLNNSTFMFCLNILKGILVDHLLSMPKVESVRKISKMNLLVSEVDFIGCSSAQAIVAFGEVMSNAFGWRVMSGTLDQTTYQVRVVKCHRFDAGIESQLAVGKIYAHKDNKQGPLAICVHERKPVIVENVKWLEGVVHENTSKFFHIHGTKSAAFLPVLDSKNVCVGAFWIEGVSGCEITFADRDLFDSIIQMLSKRLLILESEFNLKASHDSLAHFLPVHLVDSYLAGENVIEVDNGYLLMFDLKGSTRLAHAIGNANFHRHMECFKELISHRLKLHGWTLQQFVWDGFEFTLTADERKKIDIEQLDIILAETFDQWKSAVLAEFGPMPEISGLSYRICYTYGDISRGVVVEGVTRKWALTGNAIAVVTKVEQASKALSGITFADESILSRSKVEWTFLHETSQGIKVYGRVDARSYRKAA